MTAWHEPAHGCVSQAGAQTLSALRQAVMHDVEDQRWYRQRPSVRLREPEAEERDRHADLADVQIGEHGLGVVSGQADDDAASQAGKPQHHQDLAPDRQHRHAKRQQPHHAEQASLDHDAA